MKEKESLFEYNIPMGKVTMFRGHVKTYRHLERTKYHYKQFSVGFDKDHQPLTRTEINKDMSIAPEQDYTYYKYNLYGDEISFRAFNKEFDAVTASEDRIIKKTKYQEYIYLIDEAKRITRREVYDHYTGERLLAEETEFRYTDGRNVKSPNYPRNYNFSFSKTINHQRKGCSMIEKEYDSMNRCISMKDFAFGFEDKDKDSLAALTVKPGYVSGELYVYEDDNIITFPVTFTYNKAENKYTHLLTEKMITDKKWNIIQNSDCDAEGNFNGSGSKYFYDERGLLVQCDLIRNGALYYKQVYEYDEKGNVTFFDQTYKEKFKYTYEFDDHDNWILRTDFLNGKKFGTIEREITYY